MQKYTRQRDTSVHVSPRYEIVARMMTADAMKCASSTTAALHAVFTTPVHKHTHARAGLTQRRVALQQRTFAQVVAHNHDLVHKARHNEQHSAQEHPHYGVEQRLRVPARVISAHTVTRRRRYSPRRARPTAPRASASRQSRSRAPRSTPAARARARARMARPRPARTGGAHTQAHI